MCSTVQHNLFNNLSVSSRWPHLKTPATLCSSRTSGSWCWFHGALARTTSEVVQRTLGCCRHCSCTTVQQQGNDFSLDFTPCSQKPRHLFSLLRSQSTAGLLSVDFYSAQKLKLNYRCQANYASWPQSAMITGLDVAPVCDPTFSMALTVSYPSTHVPNTTC